MRLLPFAGSALAIALGLAQAAPHKFAAANGQFTLDGAPFRIVSGEMHYPRIPRAYWRDRFRKAKAMGLNAITTYVFWNVHEPSPGRYDFSGDNDVAEYIREAQQEGLYVILRPGPYVCAEWEFGGFPAWLLKDRAMVVRSSDPRFLDAVSRWFARLGRELAPLQIGRGGPIVAVQVENEYGSFGHDHGYVDQIRRAILTSGFTDALLYTADGPEELPNGTLPDLPAVVNFGPGGAQEAFAALQRFRPAGPFMSGEYWAGWFDHWGGKHAATDTNQQAADLDWMLRRGYSVSLYMFHGGTSFGWMNGANSNGSNYEPDVTSYDYDAPLDESGRPTLKYQAFRHIIAEATGTKPPPVPDSPAPMAIAPFTLAESAPLWKSLPSAVHSADPLTMEDVDQAYGYILYRTQLSPAVSGDLQLAQLHDYARIFLDGVPVGTLDRRFSQTRLPLNVPKAGAQLDILVENTGRVNFTEAIRNERKGILGAVTLAGKPVTGWDVYPLPLADRSHLAFSKAACAGPCFYRATFDAVTPGDTFLDTRAFSKGMVWLNGRALGRVWNAGPQAALYVPAPWLKKGSNEVVVFDLDGQPGRTLQGLSKPLLDTRPQGAR